jgi:hypothetical protein
MSQIRTNFMLVKVQEGQWDVLIFAEQAVLDAFVQTYKNVFYIEKSVFNESPMVVVPDFQNQNHAEVWKEYWEIAFADPENACKTCPTVQELFRHIQVNREAPQASDSAD